MINQENAFMSSKVEDLVREPNPIFVFDADVSRRDWRADLWDLYRYRYLLQNLIVRDLKVRYKNSVLGVLWSLLNPLMMMIVYTVLFTVLIPNDSIRHYPVFILVALIPWNFLSGSLVGGTVSVTSNAPLIKKVYFPRILLPVSAVISNLVNFFLVSLVLLIFIYAFGIGLTIHALWVPLILLTQVIFILGLSMLFSALHAFYRDVMMILEVLMLAWFFLTPVFYPFEWLGTQAVLLGYSPAQIMRWLNPMASIIDGYRTVLWGALDSSGPGQMDLAFLARTFITAVLTLIVGYIVFIRTEHLFGEKL
jgi:lipopolysaccharide transport system permease protein